MTYSEDSKWLQTISKLGCCGCGSPEITYEAIHKMLKDFANQNWDTDTTDDPYKQYMAYILEEKGLAEHGSNIRCSWLTDKGKEMLSALDEYEKYRYEYDEIPDNVKWVEVNDEELKHS